MSRPRSDLQSDFDEVRRSLDSLSATQAAIVSQMEESNRLMRSVSEQKPLSSTVSERLYLLAELLLQAIAALPHILLRGMAIVILALIFCLIRQAIQQL